jgi:hypothetical protein
VRASFLEIVGNLLHLWLEIESLIGPARPLAGVVKKNQAHLGLRLRECGFGRGRFLFHGAQKKFSWRCQRVGGKSCAGSGQKVSPAKTVGGKGTSSSNHIVSSL